MIRLLLVDDHESSRTPLALMLDHEPDMSAVAEAGSLAGARRALADLGEGGVDLVLLDLKLPDGEGTELIGDLRAANPRPPGRSSSAATPSGSASPGRSRPGPRGY